MQTIKQIQRQTNIQGSINKEKHRQTNKNRQTQNTSPKREHKHIQTIKQIQRQTNTQGSINKEKHRQTNKQT